MPDQTHIITLLIAALLGGGVATGGNVALGSKQTPESGAVDGIRKEVENNNDKLRKQGRAIDTITCILTDYEGKECRLMKPRRSN